MATRNLNTRLTWLAQRLRRLAEQALERRDTHHEDSTSYHYENAVVDCYSYAARALDLELAQAETVAQPANVVPFSSEPGPGVNPAQSEVKEPAGSQREGDPLDLMAQLVKVGFTERSARAILDKGLAEGVLAGVSRYRVSRSRGCLGAQCCSQDFLPVLRGVEGALQRSLDRVRRCIEQGRQRMTELREAPVWPGQSVSAATVPLGSSDERSLHHRSPHAHPGSGRAPIHAPSPAQLHHSQSSSSSSLLSGVRPSAFDGEGNAPSADTSKGDVQFSAGVIVTLYVDAANREQAEARLAQALADMEEAAARRGVTFEHELDGDVTSDFEEEA